ncbi:MAG: protein kinase [Planctomycetota bacterium]
MAATPRLERFDLRPNSRLGARYQVLEQLGSGWEGEVYKIRERGTGIERAAKLFFPHRNPKDRVARIYAKKLHKLRYCPIVIQYVSQDQVEIKGRTVTMLVSEFVEGELLSAFLKRQPGRRLPPFQAMHLLYALASGVADMHHYGEYHGDLHMDNVIVQRCGLEFDCKLLDFYDWEGSKRESRQEDIVDLVKLFYEAVGGKRSYARLPDEVKAICRGLKRSLILAEFPRIEALLTHLETFQWA